MTRLRIATEVAVAPSRLCPGGEAIPALSSGQQPLRTRRALATRAAATVLVLSAAFTAACGGVAQSRGGAGSVLEGPVWILTSFIENARVTQVGSGIYADAVFMDGTVSGIAACNQYTGGYTVRGASIQIGSLASTQMSCDPPHMAVEIAYLTALSKAATYQATSATLTIRDAGGGQLLSYEVGSLGALTGRTWHATSFNDGRDRSVAGAVSPRVGTQITALFGSDGTLSGNATCNQYRGTYTTRQSAMSVGALATTHLACPDAAHQNQESAYLQALQGAASFQVQGGHLELRDGSGSIAVVYVS